MRIAFDMEVRRTKANQEPETERERDSHPSQSDSARGLMAKSVSPWLSTRIMLQIAMPRKTSRDKRRGLAAFLSSTITTSGCVWIECVCIHTRPRPRESVRQENTREGDSERMRERDRERTIFRREMVAVVVEKRLALLLGVPDAEEEGVFLVRHCGGQTSAMTSRTTRERERARGRQNDVKTKQQSGAKLFFSFSPSRSKATALARDGGRGRRRKEGRGRCKTS